LKVAVTLSALAPTMSYPVGLAEPCRNVEELTTLLLSVEWKLTNAYGVVVWNTSLLLAPKD